MKADVVSGNPSCIHYQISLTQEYAAQGEPFILTATGIEETGAGLLNIPITLHFNIPSQPVVHQVCHHCLPSTELASFPGFPTIQFLIKNWMVGKPGNEAAQY